MLGEDSRLAANRIVAIVDDDEAVRAATVSLVRSLGHEARGFISAEEFLRHGGDDIDCLVTDVNMPGMDGLELHRRLIERGHTYPVVFVTGFPDESLRERAMKEGAFCYIGKPFSGDELVTCLERALDRGR